MNDAQELTPGTAGPISHAQDSASCAEVPPYALVQVDGLRGVVRKKYKTHAGCLRAARPADGLLAVIVDPGTRVGETIRLMSTP